MRCAIRYHLHNLKNVKNTHGEMLLLVVKLYKWYQIAQNITYIANIAYLIKKMLVQYSIKNQLDEEGKCFL